MAADSLPPETPALASDPNQGELLRSLFAQCLEQLAEGQAGALDEICRRHPAAAPILRRRMELLHGQGLLSWAAAPAAPPPQRLGEFQLLRRIGGGGMGTVYLARQESLDRLVAVKTIRADLLDAPGARARFRREAEAASRLKHPGIVPIHAVGEDQGIPYLVMDFVEGITLAQVLERLRGRDAGSLTGRDWSGALAQSPEPAPPAVPAEPQFHPASWEDGCLQIVEQAAQALHHAHGHGIVHRDVKPSNLMLTRAGRVLLLDFGLARAEGTERLTRSGTEAGSLPYLAPEILRHGAARAGPPSDCYALGVTLYELLCLCPPFLAPSAELTRRQILSGSCEPPRRLSPGVSWEAETVCLMAMNPEPDLRYADLAAFAADLDNVRRHRPIRARRSSWTRRGYRWTQRHPSAAAALLVGLAGAAALSSAVALQERSARLTVGKALQTATAERNAARRQQARADAHFRRAARAVEQLLSRVGRSRLAHDPGLDATRRGLLEDALSFWLDLLEDEPREPGVELETAEAWRHAAGIQAELGRLDQAEASYRAALELLEESTERQAAGPLGPVSRLEELILCHDGLGRVLRRLERFDGAEEQHRHAVVWQEQALAAAPGDLGQRFRLGAIHNHLAAVSQGRGRFAEASRSYRSALAVLEEVVAAAPHDGEYRRTAAGVRGNLGALLLQGGRLDEAEVELAQAVEEWELVLAGEPDHPGHKAELSRCLGYLAEVERKRGAVAAAEQRYRQALALLEGLAVDFPLRPEYRQQLGAMLQGLGLLLRSCARMPEAEQALRRGLILDEILACQYPDQPLYRESWGSSVMNYGAFLDASGRREEAARAFAQASEILAALARDHPGNPRHRRELARACSNLAWELRALGRLEEAEQEYRRALAAREELAAGDPENLEFAHELASGHRYLGELLQERGRLEEAEQHAARSCSLMEQLDARFPGRSALRRGLAASLQLAGALCQENGDMARAELLLAAALERREELAREQPDQPEARSDLAECLAALAALRWAQEPAAGREEALLLVERAVELQRGALAANPDHPLWRQRLAAHLELQERLTGAGSP